MASETLDVGRQLRRCRRRRRTNPTAAESGVDTDQHLVAPPPVGQFGVGAAARADQRSHQGLEVRRTLDLAVEDRLQLRPTDPHIARHARQVAA
jgi:hypothetical protein